MMPRVATSGSAVERELALTVTVGFAGGRQVYGAESGEDHKEHRARNFESLQPGKTLGSLASVMFSRTLTIRQYNPSCLTLCYPTFYD
jgi:hypothetical protein